MSAHIADSWADSGANRRFTFKLPSLSYIDAKWEEPDLHASEATPHTVRKPGLAAWLSRQINAYVAWRNDKRAGLELTAMSDHELADIGLSRSDLPRVFERDINQDLRLRGIAS